MWTKIFAKKLKFVSAFPEYNRGKSKNQKNKWDASYFSIQVAYSDKIENRSLGVRELDNFDKWKNRNFSLYKIRMIKCELHQTLLSKIFSIF